ncbi:hypothetical protein ACFE04_015428 [Oxalis oulophora]
MDIPDIDELEFLEANSHNYYEDEYLDDLQPPEEEEPVKEPEPRPESPNQITKRRRSNSPHSSDQRIDIHSDDDDVTIIMNNNKKSKFDNDDDEDWLHYSPPPQPTVQSPQIEHQEEEEKVLSRYASQIDGEFIPITAPGGGDRVYAKVCRVSDDEERVKKLSYKAKSKDLIREPVRVLMQRMEQEAFTKALQASSEDQTDESVQQAPVVHQRLWVDKYAPISFTELLSDEQTNREVLLWLKQWDSHVFGSEIKSTSDDVLSSLRRQASVSQHQKHSDFNSQRNNGGPKWSNRSFKNSYSSNNNSNFKKSYSSNTDKSNFKNSYSSNTDKSNFKNSYSSNTDKSFNGNQDLSNRKMRSTGPPEQKILLLCGSPGLGKTTLAHVAAKHCGYHVLELNASDDRSSSSIEAKILDVVQMNSVMADAKPKCLVIDEIDGSLGDGKGAVDVILKMVSAEKKHVSEKENDQSAKKSSKKGHKASTLSRPVICICNDLFAPALRRLRQVAKVHVFVQPSVSRVASRLKFICNKEGMRTSSIALTALAEYTECDIRSCLNTLQFLNKKKEALDVMGISSQVVGRKDMSKGVFDIWKEIFQKKKVKQERKHNNTSTSVLSNEFDSLYNLVSHRSVLCSIFSYHVKTATLLTGVFTECRGDYDLIFDGIHENFLQLSYHDPMMHKTVKCLNSIGISDLMHQYIMRTQKMSIYVYQPSLSIIIHKQIAQVQRPNLEWPKSNQRYRTMLIEKNEVFKSWHVKIRPCISRHLSTKSFLEDSVSLLLHILSPTTLRPVALHLLSEKEKNELAQLVSTMVSYSITYKNVKSDPSYSDFGHGSAADTHELSFDPPINSFINFKYESIAVKQGYGSGHRVLAIPMKQLLLHEVEKQKILQAGFKKLGPLTDECNKENQNLVGEQTRGKQPFIIDRPATVTGNNSRPSNPSKSLNPSTSQNTSATSSVKPNPTADKKKRSNGPTNFFDRFRKPGSKGSQSTAAAVEKMATLERDSRPVLFKFNEGFTNAVKRPVRMREFLQ